MDLRLEIHCHAIGGKIKVDKFVDSNSPANDKVRSLLTHDIAAYVKDRMPCLLRHLQNCPGNTEMI